MIVTMFQDDLAGAGDRLAERLGMPLIDAVPQAVLLLGSDGRAAYVNQRAAEMIGAPAESLIGRSGFEFVAERDVAFALSLLEAGDRYRGRLMGPSRLHYLDADGGEHLTQMWAVATPEHLDFDGYVITLTNESVRDILATAVSSVVDGDDLEPTLEAIASSVRGMPVVGRGAVIVPVDIDDPSAGYRAVGTWPLDDEDVNLVGSPWMMAIEFETDLDVDLVNDEQVLDLDRRLLVAAGSVAAFVRIVRDGDGSVQGAVVVFRSDDGPASPNQDAHLRDVVGLASLACSRAALRERLERDALRDPLTGIGNRAAFARRIDDEHRRVDILFVDVDEFKAVNDTYGHDLGDVVIARSAERLCQAVRGGDEAFRIGGDEFVVVCDPMTSDEERENVAARVVALLGEPIRHDDHEVRVGATVGIADGAGRTGADTVSAADSALYEAKASPEASWVHAPPAVADAGGSTGGTSAPR